MISLTIALLAIAAAAGVCLLVYALQSPGKRWRRLVSGSVLILSVVPAWLFLRGGYWQTGRTYLLLVPMGRSDLALSVIHQLPHGTPVAVATIDPNPASLSKSLGWLSSNPAVNSIPTMAAFKLDTDGFKDVAGATVPPLQWRAFPYFLPKPTALLLDDASDIISNTSPNSITVCTIDSAMHQHGVDFFRVDTSSGPLAGGRLDLSLSTHHVSIQGTSIPTTQFSRFAIEATLSLLNCRYPATGPYHLKAWIDRVTPSATQPAGITPESQQYIATMDDNGPTVASGSAPIDPRVTKFVLGDMSPINELKLGYHQLSIELSFNTTVDGHPTSLTYSQSDYFEIDSPKVVVMQRAGSDDLMLRSWVHREPGPDHTASTPPPKAADLLNQLVTNMREGGNAPRMPFSNVEIQPSVDNLTNSLGDACELLLIEPTAEDLSALDTNTFKQWIAAGHSLVIAGPPVIAGQPPEWLPATAAPLPAPSTQPVQERTDLRLYFVVDASRPGSSFHTFEALPPPAPAGSTADTKETGIRLQHLVIEGLLAKLKAHRREDPTPTTMTELDQPDPKTTTERLVVKKPASVLLGTIGNQPITIIPPIMQELGKAADAPQTYQKLNNGILADIASSWIAPRLSLLMSAERSEFYGSILSSLVNPPVPEGFKRADLDLPLFPDEWAPGTVVVAFSADIDQPKDFGKGFPHYFAQVGRWHRWMLKDSDAEDSNRSWVDPSKIVSNKIHLIVVPIQLAAAYTADNDNAPYGNKYRSLLTGADGAGIIPGGAKGAAEELKAQYTTPLELVGSDDDAEKSVPPVVDGIWRILTETAKETAQLSMTDDRGRAVDARCWQSVRVPFSWRHLKPTAAIVDPVTGDAPAAARIGSTVGQGEAALYWLAYGQGTVHVLAYNPFTYDRWKEDLGTFQEADGKYSYHYDGWGLQRLIDPRALLRGGQGLRIASLSVAPDRSYATVTCCFESENFEIPKLLNEKEKVAGVVQVLGVDMHARTATLTISAGSSDVQIPSDTLAGNYHLFANDQRSEDIFLDLNKTSLGGGVPPPLDRIAALSGGTTIPLVQLGDYSTSPLNLLWLAGVSLPLLVILLLSPFARAWSVLKVLRRLRRRRPDPSEVQSEDQADAVAAVSRGGMSFGESQAQRPSGPILQLRPMRQGDSSTAARRGDWIYFIDEIASALGSPLLPRVYETPKEQALSIITLLDLHPGSFVNDRGDFSDRQRALTRIAVLNSLASSRRSGEHRVAAFQVPEEPENTMACDPDAATKRIADLSQQMSQLSGKLQVPEFLMNEMVIVVTDPASLQFEQILPRFLAAATQSACRLGILLLTHPSQLVETGCVRPAGRLILLDRADLDAGAVSFFHQTCAETWAARASMADGVLVRLRTDQWPDEVATILAEDIWVR
jgi:hypothetical protein